MKVLRLFWATFGALSVGSAAGGMATPTEPTQTITGAASHFVALGTNKVHYLTDGKGERTLVFVHCWAGHSGFWREQVPALAGRARLVLIDLPGHGRSDKPRTDYSLDFFARAVLAVMDDARVDKATLVGHSMGVPVICRVYTRAPERVAAMVAVDGTLRRGAIELGEAEAFMAPFRGAEYREHTTRYISSLFPQSGTEALCDRVLADLLATPQHVMTSAMDGLYGTGRPDWDLKKVTVPIMVINVANPRWTDDDKAYVQGLSPKTDYRTLDGVGHWLMLERPAEFNALLIELLGKFDLLTSTPDESRRVTNP